MPDSKLIPTDEEFINALRQEYFPDDAANPFPKVAVEVRKRLPKVRQESLAHTSPGDPNIYVHTGTKAYERLRKGDAETRKYYAGILEHENTHLKSYPDTSEVPAYAAELAFLKKIGASPKTIKRVLDAQKAVGGG